MPRHYRQILAKFRSGSLPIRIESGRYEKIPLDERQCNFCTGGHIEDEMHVLLNCKLYDDLRYEMFQHMSMLDKHFMDLPPLVKLCKIMTTETVQYLLAKYLNVMYKRRKLHEQF